MDKKKVLVVDDDPDIRETICFNLEREGYGVSSAKNGWEALGAVRASEPDLVILDVRLPKENGSRVCQFIKNDIKKGVYRKNIIIILLTGLAVLAVHDPEREKKLRDLSGSDHLMYKPFEMEQLMEKVHDLLIIEE